MKYWNGHCWVEGMVTDPIHEEECSRAERAALLDAELNPRTTTDEDVTVTIVRVEAKDPNKWISDMGEILSGATLARVESGEAEDPVDMIEAMVEQPVPNLIDRSVDVFSRSAPQNQEEPVTSRVITRDEQELGIPKHQKEPMGEEIVVDDPDVAVTQNEACPICDAPANVECNSVEHEICQSRMMSWTDIGGQETL